MTVTTQSATAATAALKLGRSESHRREPRAFLWADTPRDNRVDAAGSTEVST